jgi:hypothetical protein
MKRIRNAGLVLGAGVLAAWLASAAAESFRQPGAPAPADQVSAPAEPPIFDLHTEATRLRARLDAAPAPIPRQRDPFRFDRGIPPSASAAATPRTPRSSAASAEPDPPVAPAMPLRLVGVAEEQGDSGVLRVAILSTGVELFHAREGDLVAGRYRVRVVGAELVELQDEPDGVTHRLALR